MANINHKTMDESYDSLQFVCCFDSEVFVSVYINYAYLNREHYSIELLLDNPRKYGLITLYLVGSGL